MNTTHWVGIHLGQFVGVALMAMALVALAATFEPGLTSLFALTIFMVVGAVDLIWAILAGILMWRPAPQLAGDTGSA